jgi:transposase
MAAKKIELHNKTILYQYQNGMSINRIATLHYVSEDTVYRRLRKMGVNIQSPFMRSIDTNKLKKLYVERKWSISAIAKKYHVSYKTVKKALLELDIPIQSKRTNSK